MNAHGAAERHADPVVRTASDWLVARDRGLTADERVAFDAWLRADARHATVFAELDQTWNLLAAMPDEPAWTPVDNRARSRRTFLRWAMPLGAAAALAAGFSVWWRSADSASYAATAATDVGGFSRLDLPDGSVVQLNTNSAVRVTYSLAARHVALTRGEAHFSVAKDAARPFTVSAASVRVRAVGTAFDVHLRATAVEVTVTEGRVGVADALSGRSLLASPADSFAPMDRGGANAPAPILAAGERAIIPLDPATDAPPRPAAVTSLDPPQIAQLLAWRERQLRFVAEPLATIAGEFNRCNRHKVTISDPRLAAKRFGGTLPSNDYVSFVRVLQSEFGVVIEQRADETILRLPE